MGKGLMTDTGAPAKKSGRSKGLISQKGAPMKKHGIGKGLMRVWQMTNTEARDFPSYGISSESLIQQKKNSYQQRQNILRKLSNKEQAKRKIPLSRKVEYQKVEKRNRKEKCELALDGERCLENSEHFSMLIDDEELELRELQAGPNPLTCSAHFTTNGSHGCSLCKDLLAKFPPNAVTMRPLFYVQPWDSSPELVKKLFKTAGAVGGAASSIVRVPTEVVKQRMQTGQFASAPNAVGLIVAKEGIRGLYAVCSTTSTIQYIKAKSFLLRGHHI